MSGTSVLGVLGSVGTDTQSGGNDSLGGNDDADETITSGDIDSIFGGGDSSIEIVDSGEMISDSELLNLFNS